MKMGEAGLFAWGIHDPGAISQTSMSAYASWTWMSKEMGPDHG